MSIFKSIISPMQNCDQICAQFCKQLNVSVTETTIRKEITEHPDYPSLLSISDALSSYKMENLSLKTTIDNFYKLPTPFIAQIRGEKSKYTLFAIVNSISTDQTINWYNPENKRDEFISLSKFEEFFTGYVMLAEADEKSGEQDFEKKRKEERTINFWNGAIAISFPLLFIFISIFSIYRLGFLNSILPIGYGFVTLLGAIIGAMLLLFEIDQFNPTLQKVCHAGKKTNCAAILNSKASRIFGISWGNIGFTYFCGVLISLLLSGIVNQKALSIAAWLNLAALPYVLFSVYYQWKIAKQWCPMCLIVQLMLVLQCIIALSGNFYQLLTLIEFPILSIFILSFIIVFITVQLLIPALIKAKEGKYTHQELQRLKHDPITFEAQLSKQKQITEATKGLGLSLGEADAPIKLVKVCNPYCAPCAKAHLIIEDLLNNNPNIQLQIIFTATTAEDDYRNLPVKHFLAIDQKGDKELLYKSLNDWYLMEEKKINVFKENYPVDKELLNETSKIKAMDEWCEKVNIAFTPTFFINGYQLPEMYNVSDLKYFLSV